MIDVEQKALCQVRGVAPTKQTINWRMGVRNLF